MKKRRQTCQSRMLRLIRMAAPRPSSIVASDEKIAQTLQEEYDTEAAEEAAHAANGGSIPAMEKLEVRCVRVWAP